MTKSQDYIYEIWQYKVHISVIMLVQIYNHMVMIIMINNNNDDDNNNNNDNNNYYYYYHYNNYNSDDVNSGVTMTITTYDNENYSTEKWLESVCDMVVQPV